MEDPDQLGPEWEAAVLPHLVGVLARNPQLCKELPRYDLSTYQRDGGMHTVLPRTLFNAGDRVHLEGNQVIHLNTGVTVERLDDGVGIGQEVTLKSTYTMNKNNDKPIDFSDVRSGVSIRGPLDCPPPCSRTLPCCSLTQRCPDRDPRPQVRVGVLVLYVHDASDIVADLLKIFNYCSLEGPRHSTPLHLCLHSTPRQAPPLHSTPLHSRGLFLVEIVFISNFGTWGYYRLYYFLRHLLWSKVIYNGRYCPQCPSLSVTARSCPLLSVTVR